MMIKDFLWLLKDFGMVHGHMGVVGIIWCVEVFRLRRKKTLPRSTKKLRTFLMLKMNGKRKQSKVVSNAILIIKECCESQLHLLSFSQDTDLCDVCTQKTIFLFFQNLENHAPSLLLTLRSPLLPPFFSRVARPFGVFEPTHSRVV